MSRPVTSSTLHRDGHSVLVGAAERSCAPPPLRRVFQPAPAARDETCTAGEIDRPQEALFLPCMRTASELGTLTSSYRSNFTEYARPHRFPRGVVFSSDPTLYGECLGLSCRAWQLSIRTILPHGALR